MNAPDAIRQKTRRVEASVCQHV